MSRPNKAFDHAAISVPPPLSQPRKTDQEGVAVVGYGHAAECACGEHATLDHRWPLCGPCRLRQCLQLPYGHDWRLLSNAEKRTIHTPMRDKALGHTPMRPVPHKRQAKVRAA